MGERVLRTCHLCSAGCGLSIEVENDRVVSVHPDRDDPITGGYVCPKGLAIAEIQNDPDRLRRPMRRAADGTFHEISWDEAFDLVGARLNAIRDEHSPDAIGVYFGNPLGHHYSAILMLGPLVKAIGTRNRMSSSSQDAAPRFGASCYLYGNTLIVPVPDLQRTDWFLCIGANPAVSQGSLMLVSDVKSQIRGIRERGGKVITVDPRSTETAKLADEHVFIRPGGDAAFLLAMLQVLIADDLVDSEAVEAIADGWPAVERLVAPFTPERVESLCGIRPDTVRRLARELAAAQRGVVYTRLGTCNNRWGTLATWANDLLNLATGNLGKAGGAMFPEPALDLARVAHRNGLSGHGRWHSRVRGLPEIQSDIPAAALAEEIETEGEGQIRALVTIAGNPVLSTPNGRRLDRALGQLDFMVSIDLYINETTRHADVILPPCWVLADDSTEALASGFALDNHVRWCPPVIERREDERSDWQIMLEITKRMGGGPLGIGALDRLLERVESLGWSFEPEWLLNLILRVGPHGDRFRPWRDGINLEKIKAEDYGIHLGPAREGVLHRVFHEDGRVHLEAPPITDSLEALAKELDREHSPDQLLMIGRRHLRSCNSWMHNLPSLVAGRDRCVLFVNPIDAQRAGLRDSQPALLSSRVFSGEVAVRVTDELMPGVVSLPHGWGHAAIAPWQSVAGQHAGVSANDWSDEEQVEDVVGQSILNGVPVTLAPAPVEGSGRELTRGRV